MKKDYFRKILNIYPESNIFKENFINQNRNIDPKPEQISKKVEVQHSDSFIIN